MKHVLLSLGALLAPAFTPAANFYATTCDGLYKLPRFMRHGVSAAVDEKREVLRLAEQLIHIGDLHEHQRALALREWDAIVERRR